MTDRLHNGLSETPTAPFIGYPTNSVFAVLDSPEQVRRALKDLEAVGVMPNAAAVFCDGYVAYHIADALRAGASREEVTEAVGVAVMMGGGPAAIYGAQALDALRQFEDHPKDWATV